MDPKGGVIAGHGRLLAAKALGIEEVPVIVARGWSPAQKRAYVLADNQLALNAGWDPDLLRVEIDELHEIFDTALLGFPDDDVSPLDQFPDLASGDRAPFQQVTFTLHDDQVGRVKSALDAAKAVGAFMDSPNENSNGNALARVCEAFLVEHANG